MSARPLSRLVRRSLVGILLLAAAGIRAQGDPAAALGRTEIRVLGLAVDVDTRPDVPGLQTTMTAVKDVPTGVETFVGSRLDPAERTQIAGSRVKAELSGPSFGATSIEVTASPNALLELPLLRASGLHRLTNVRLEDAGGRILLARDAALPPVEIEVIDELLVTSVTSRPLTLDEIRSRGIVIDESNFTALNFVVGLSFGSEKVTIDLPVLVPRTQQALESVEAPQLTSLPIEPEQLRKINIPNFSLAGFQMRAPPELEADDRQLIPAIAGVIIIPGNIAFLHQFFSVVLQASNIAPSGSGLVLRQAVATVALPKGGDELAGTGDDPLRMAVIASGPQPTTLPLLDPDGSPDIPPQRTNSAEFLVEGLREGTHDLRFDLAGDLFVPALGRTVPMKGVAAGVVQVRNPTFSIVLAHPKVVREGEGYPFFATVTNTSATTANLFQIELAARSLSGAALAPGQLATRSLDTLAGGDSATFEWRLVAKITGEVTGTVFLAQEGINGSFRLTTGVGDTGIPLSPDTLVLPQIVSAIPGDPPLVFAAVRMLGQAYSVATAPRGALPPDVARISKGFVFDRAVRVAQVGLHVRLGEPLAAATQELLLDWLGNDLARLDVLEPDARVRLGAESDLRAFDALRRAADAGSNFVAVTSQVLANSLAGRSGADLAKELGARFASRPAFLAIGASGRGAPLALELTDAGGSRLGGLDASATPVSEIPFAARLPLRTSTTASDDLLLVASPGSGAYELSLRGATDAAEAALALVVADAAGSVEVTWPPFTLADGAVARLRVTPGSANAFSIGVDDDADGDFERSVVPSLVRPVIDVPPTPISAQQWAKGARPDTRPSFESGDPLGRLVAVLFDEEVEAASAEDPAHYTVAENHIISAALQPDRRTVFVVTERPIGPFVPRALTVSSVRDVRAHELASHAAPIGEDPERGVAGRASGQVLTVDGRAVPFARVKYIQPLDQFSLFDCFPKDFTIFTTQADAAGRFAIDFVLQSGFRSDEICNGDRWLNDRAAGPTNHFKLEAEDPTTGDIAKLSTRIQFDGQQLRLQLVSRGFASLEGTVFDELGAPIAGGDPGTPASFSVLATNLSTGERALAWVDAEGRYAFPRSFVQVDGTKLDAPELPVGNVALLALRSSDGLTGVVTTNLPGAGVRVTQDLVMSPPFRFGSVSGVVFEADGRTPAPNVVVDLAGQILSGFGLSGREAQEGLLASVVTDASGGFRVEHVPAGNIEVAATRQATFEQMRVASAVAGGVETALQLVLPGGGGTVRGLVRDPFGNVVAGALVAGGPTLTTTDDQGRFEIRGLPRGTFTISSRRAESPALGKVDVTTKRADDVQDVVLTLEPVGSIDGSVREADGLTPVAGQKVQLWFGPNSAVAAETFTDPDGAYHFEGYPLGRYSVRAIRKRDLDGGMAETEVRFAGDVRDVDVTFRGLGEISGRVIQDNGTPAIADVIITRKVWRIIPDEGPSADNAALGLEILQQFAQIPGLGDFVDRTVSENGLDQAAPEFFFLLDESVALRSDELGPGGAVTGLFHFRGDATGGPFSIAAFGPFLAPAEVKSEIPRTTHPDARKVDVGDIVLEPATGAVRGTVFLPDGLTPVGENVRVKLRSLGRSGDVQSSVGTQTQPVLPEIDAVTAPDGTFEFPLVLRGGVVLTADTGVPEAAIAARSASEIRTDAFENENGGRLLNVRLFGQAQGAVPKLPVGEFVSIDLRLEDVAGTRVRVVESDGTTAVPGARVQVTTASSLDTDPAAAFTDDRGEVDFFPLPEGTFSVSVSVPGRPQRGGAAGSVPINGPNGLELPVRVQLGAVTTASGQVVSASIFGSVGGVVHRADGAALSNPAEVTVKAGGLDVVTTSGADGRYRADNVPGGFFRVEVFEPFTARRGTAEGSLRDDGALVAADVTLVGLGEVSGSVLSSDGARGLPNVDVFLAPSGSFSDRLVTRSDASGSYTLPGVALGSYTVTASEFASGLTGQASGVLKRDGDRETTDVRLEPAGGISGVVYAPGVLLDAQGLPVKPDGSPDFDAPGAAGVQISIVGGSGFHQSVQTGTDGSFASSGFLPLGDYTLAALSLTSNDGASVRTRLRFDGEIAFAAVALRGTGRVEGVVVDSLGLDPVSGASVTLASESPFQGGAVTRITNAEGRFAFEDVPVGRFSVSIRTNLQVPTLGGAASGELLVHAERIVFADGDADPLHGAIELQPAGNVLGRVVLAAAASPATGAAVLLDGNGVRLTRLADATGGFRFEGIPLGTYALSIREPVTNGVAGRSISLVTNGQESDLGTIFLDDLAPRVLSVAPAPGASGVDPAEPIVFRFSEPIDPASVDAEALEIVVESEPVAGVFTVAGSEVRFAPAARFVDLANVAVRLRGEVVGFEGQVLFSGVRDLAGRGVEGNFESRFTTADTTPPSVVSVSPPANASDVDLRAVLRIELSEAIDRSSLLGAELRNKGGAPIAGALEAPASLGDRVVVFTPAQRLAPNDLVSWRIAGPLRDRSGNAMVQASLAGSFATLDTLAPAVSSLGAAPGARLVQGRTVVATAALAETDTSARVEFYLAGALVGVDTAEPYEQPILLSRALGSAVRLGAVALDAAGNRSAIRETTLAIAPNAPPSVRLLAPSSGVVAQGGAVTVSVEAEDDVGLAELRFTAGDGGVASGARPGAGAESAQASFSFRVPAGIAAGGSIDVRASATDLLGVTAEADVVARLTVADTLAPRITFTSPAPGGEIVPGSLATLVVRADDASGVATLRLEAPALGFDETRSFSAGTTPATASFTIPVAAEAVPGSTSFTARAVDLGGNASSRNLELRIADRVVPRVLLVDPPDGTTGVGLRPTLRVLFSRPIAPASVNGVSVSLLAGSGGTVPLTFALSADGLTLTIRPELLLRADTRHVLSLAGLITDLVGNPLANTASAFTTGAADTTAPRLLSLEPADASTDASARPILRAIFDEPMSQASFGTTGLGLTRLGDDGSAEPVAATMLFELDDSVARLELTDALAPGARYALALSGAVTDLSGNRVTDVAGEPIGSELRNLFTVGGFALILPAADTRVVEGQTLTLAVAAAPALGIDSVVFTTNGAEAGIDATPPFAIVLTLPGLGVLGDDPALRLGARGRVAGVVRFTAAEIVVEVNAAAADADGDGVTNGAEASAGTDPFRADATEDPDGDGLTNAEEIALGTAVGAADTDGDGLSDFEEVRSTGTNPRNADTDGDGIPDALDLASGPRLIAADPADGATNISVRPLVRVSFDEPLDPASATAARVRLLDPAAGIVPTTLALADTGRTLELRPDAALAFETSYTVSLASGLTDDTGRSATEQDGSALHDRTFRTGSFAITAPASGDAVLERSQVPVSASGSAALGIASVEFIVNGAIANTDPAAPFGFTLDVPPIATGSTLTLMAVARDALGTELARASVTLDVVVGLRAERRLLGVALGGTGTLRLLLRAPQAIDLPVMVEAVDPAVVGVPVGPFVLRAGETLLAIPLTGLAEGGTTVVARSDRDVVPIHVSVTPANTVPVFETKPAPGETPPVIADAHGVAAQTLPSAGFAVLSPFESATLSARFLASPAPAAVPVTASTSNAAVATVRDGARIEAGSTELRFTVDATGEGDAVFTLRTGAGGREFRVRVGPPISSATPPTVAAPLGVAILPLPSAGDAILPAASTRTVTIRLFDAPVASDTSVVVTTSDTAVARAAGSVIVRAGTTDATLPLETGIAGEAILTLRTGDVGRELRVIVGVPAADRRPVVIAAPLGIAVIPLPSAGDVVLPAGATRTLTIRFFDAPIAAATTVDVSTSDASIVRPSGSVLIPAGGTDAAILLETGIEGRAVLTLRAGDVGRELGVIVGIPAPDRRPLALAAPVGISVIPLPSAGEVIVPTGEARTLRLRLLDSPASEDLAIQVVSSDPAVASIAGSVFVPAGSTEVELPIETGIAGEAVLTLRSGDFGRELHVIVGTPPPGRRPAIVATPLGIVVLEDGFAGTLFVDPGKSRTIHLRLFPFPSLLDLPVAATSDDPSVATVLPAQQTLLTGGEQITLTLAATAPLPAETRVVLRFGPELQTLRVVVGRSDPVRAPTTIASPLGVEVEAAP